MTRTTGRLAAALLALLVTCSVRTQEQSLIDFRLEDQFDRQHSDDEYRGSVIVLLASGRKGSQFNDEWDEAIRKGLDGEQGRDKVRFLPLADLRGVPFFLKGMVKGKFPKEKESWVLLDWKGVFAKTYGHDPDSCNIAVFAFDGRLVHQARGRELDEAKLGGILEAIRELLHDPVRPLGVLPLPLLETPHREQRAGEVSQLPPEEAFPWSLCLFGSSALVGRWAGSGGLRVRVARGA